MNLSYYNLQRYKITNLFNISYHLAQFIIKASVSTWKYPPILKYVKEADVKKP